MAQVIVRNECGRLRGRRVGEFSYAGIRRLVEGRPGVQDLRDFPVDLEPYGAGGHVAEHGAEMDMKAGAFAGRDIDLLHFDQTVRQIRGQQMLSFDRRHAEY